MKKAFFLILIVFCLITCSDRRPSHTGELPIIDVIGNMGNFQRVYMSDLFSSIELIPLETREDCLLNFTIGRHPLFNDSIIIMVGDNFRRLFAFDRTTGEFRNQIGGQGQGPGEFTRPHQFFFNIEKPTVFVYDIGGRRLLEYDFAGRYVSSFSPPEIDGVKLLGLSHVGDSLFIGWLHYTGNNAYKYFLFDHNGIIVQRFPNHIFFNKQGGWASSSVSAMTPARVDNRFYVMDKLNDTVFVFQNSSLQPAFVFDFDRSLPLEYLEWSPSQGRPTPLPNLRTDFLFVATPHFFFYDVTVPLVRSRQRQRIRPFWNPYLGEYQNLATHFFGIFDIVQNRNILLDTDQHLRQGIVNDINGGLSFIPRFYAGNGQVIGLWYPEDMLEILTEEYFATKTIRDSEAHQRLREVLRNLEFDDNPVVVVARLK